MKRNILLTAGLLWALLAQNSLMAQDTKGTGFADVKGINIVNAGIGLGSYGLFGTGGLPLTISFEHGFSKYISAGVNAGFVQRKYVGNEKYTYLIFGARGSYHFNQVLNLSNPKVDVYGGAGLIYRHYQSKSTDRGADQPSFDFKVSDGTIDFDLHAGGHYLFNDHIGAYAEVGYGIAPLQLGITLKL